MTIRSDTLDRLLEVARSQVGTERQRTNKVKYNTSYYGHEVSGDAFKWCVVFIWWCMQKCSVPMDVFPKTARVFTVRDWYKKRGRFFPMPAGPKKGDLVIYSYSHIGLVAQVLPDDNILTIEGNQDDAVRKLTRGLNTSDIEGFCRPAYHLVEADVTNDELLDALESARGRQIMQDAVRPVVHEEVLTLLRAGFGGMAPEASSESVNESQKFLFKTVLQIHEKLP